MATRHLIVLDSEGLLRELPSGDIADFSNNVVDVKSLRLIDSDQVVYSLPSSRGYFGQTLVTGSQGNVGWQSLDSVQYTDSELLFAFNNSISELNHDYIAADSDNLSYVLQYVNVEVANRINNAVDSDWVLRQTPKVQADSDWIKRQLYTKAQSDSDLLGKTQVSNTFYVNTGGNTFANAITKVGTSLANQIVVPPGSVNAGSVTITNANILNITGPVAPSAAPAVEILGKITVTGASSTRVRFSHIQFDSEFELNGTQGRHSFKGVVFEKAMRITGSTTNFLIFEDCSFDGGFIVPNTFAGLIYLVRCSFNNIAPTLSQSLPLQVIMTQCTSLPSFPANATVTGMNSLTSGFIREQVNELLIGKTKINPNIDSDWIGRQVAAGSSTTSVQVAQEFTADSDQRTFTLSHTPLGAVAVFRNGIRVKPSAISVSGTTLTYIPANNQSSKIAIDDCVVCDYIRSVG